LDFRDKAVIEKAMAAPLCPALWQDMWADWQCPVPGQPSASTPAPQP
jgi:hypothetical protein